MRSRQHSQQTSWPRQPGHCSWTALVTDTMSIHPHPRPIAQLPLHPQLLMGAISYRGMARLVGGRGLNERARDDGLARATPQVSRGRGKLEPLMPLECALSPVSRTSGEPYLSRPTFLPLFGCVSRYYLHPALKGRRQAHLLIASGVFVSDGKLRGGTEIWAAVSSIRHSIKIAR